MSASTQAKPRAGRVGVRKMYYAETPEGSGVALPHRVSISTDEPCLVITNPPPGLSCAKLKRLVEIAGMDEDSFSAWMTKVYAESSRDGKGTIKAMREALGLSSARGGRK